MAYWARQPARSNSSSSAAVGKYSSWKPSFSLFTQFGKSPFPPIAQSSQGIFAQRPGTQTIFRSRIHISTECRDLIESVIFTKAITERSFYDMQRVNLGTYLQLVKDNTYLFRDICGASRGELVVLEILKLLTNDAHNQLITAQKLIDDLEKRTLLNIPPRREDTLAELASYKERVQSAYYGLEVGDISGRTISSSGITNTTALLPVASRGVAAAPSSMGIDMVTASLPVGMEVHGLRSSDSWSQVMLNLQTEHSRLRSTDAAISVVSMGSASASAEDAAMIDIGVSDRIDALMAQPRLPAPVLFADDEEDAMDIAAAVAPPAMPITAEALIAHRFLPLTEEEERRVDDVVYGPATDVKLIEKFATPMTRFKMVCLRPNTWLNDEVINFYLCMLKEREIALREAYPSRRESWFSNSFFIEKLLISDKAYTYKNVARWSKKFDVFEFDKLYFPVNLSNTHWTLLVMYMQRKEIHYYDSMSGSGKKYLEGLLRWLVDEAQNKKKIDNYDTSDWKTFDRERHVPQQRNGVDCGVFVTMCADFISDDLELAYSQDDMLDFRNKICADILRGSLNYPV